jgi:hypothetical protein
MEKKKVILTIDNGEEDILTEKEFGRVGLRQLRIQRITQEALEQSAVLSQEDIGRCLFCDVRTVKRDIRAIKNRGIDVITRGVLHNIGRGQTHKVKIIGLYLDSRTYSEIKLKTQHSIGSIKRYLDSFTRVLAAGYYGFKDNKQISDVSGLSENLVKQYGKLIEESQSNKLRLERMSEMVESWIKSEALKKRMLKSGYRAVVTMGGYV